MKSSWKTVIISGLCCIIVIILFFNGVPQKQNNAVVIFATEAGNIEFYCSIADDSESRRKGLLGVSELDNDSGMLFVYPSAQPRVFTMKQMMIPIDIIFIDETYSVIHIVEAGIDEDSIKSNRSAQFVVEINHGLAEKYEISLGSSVEIIFEKDI